MRVVERLRGGGPRSWMVWRPDLWSGGGIPTGDGSIHAWKDRATREVDVWLARWCGADPGETWVGGGRTTWVDAGSGGDRGRQSGFGVAASSSEGATGRSGGEEQGAGDDQHLLQRLDSSAPSARVLVLLLDDEGEKKNLV
jgi:hypothetical protein